MRRAPAVDEPPPARFRVLILGGYGLFGQRIVAALAGEDRMRLMVAGRDVKAAARSLEALWQHGVRAELSAHAIDVEAPNLADRIAHLAPDLVIHAAGPFQGRDYRVAEAALDAGAHYVDLADARAFVGDIDRLAERAQKAARWVVSGASSVPGLSAAVIEAHRERFAVLDAVEIAISPGNRTERGRATTQAILGYVGQPFPLLRDGRWIRAHGWQSLRRYRLDGVGARWLARCEVPDLSVLPARYPQLTTCDFRAGLELRRMHFGLWLASWAVRAGLVRNLAAWADPLLALSRRWQRSGSDIGVMVVDLRGRDAAGAALHLRWTLTAGGGDGPQIPATAAVVLAQKLACGALHGGGARACVDLFTLDEFLQALRGFAVTASLSHGR